ncbi:MAG TPA: methyltransferase [Acidobacteriaceae bacterium]|nr:methyltransferase [Acidobacteriaceae bacterium]
MSQGTAVQAGGPPPEAQIAEILLSQVVGRLVHLAATLRLSDYLADGPKSADELASKTGTQARALYRVMRTLSSLGFFSQDAEHRFALCPLGAVLKSGTPSHAAAMTLAGPILMRSFDQLLYSVQTGKTAFEQSFGTPIFEWLGTHPDETALFTGTMIGFHGMEPPAIAAAYDFSGFGTIADVGGSTGNLLSTILAKYPGPRGILYDLPQVVANAPALLEQRGLRDRVQIESGSFFESVPGGADAYILSHVIHDWNHEQCLTILTNCRRAMKSDGRLLLVEMVLPDGDAPHPGKMLDMVMLTVPGGEERTAAEYRALLDEAGFRMTRLVPTASLVTIVEAVPR